MITVVFNSGETRKNAKGLWQYSYGQVLRIQGLSLPPAVEIHFALQEKGGSAVTRIGATENGITDVVIPDSMLKNDGLAADYKIYAWIYFTSEESGETKYMITLQVKSRPEPETYDADEDTPVSGGTMAAILSAVNRIAAGKADNLKYQDSILRLLSGDTELARVLIAAGSGTGGADAREIELQKGETAIQWRYAGDEEWTDLVTLAEITGADGVPGEQGPKGETGAAGPEGPQGETGPAGADGKSAYQYAQDGGYTGTEEGFVQRLLQSGIKSIVGTNDAPVNAWELEPGIYQLHGKMMADSNTAVTALNHNYILFAIRQSTYGSNIVYLFSDDIGGLKIIFPDADESFSTGYVDSSELENCQFVSRKWEMPASETTAAIWPDDFYIWPEMTSLTVSFVAPESNIANIVHEYHWRFTSGATPTELVLPDTVRVPSGFVIEANKIYEMSVLENCLTYQSWDWEAEA